MMQICSHMNDWRNMHYYYLKFMNGLELSESWYEFQKIKYIKWNEINWNEYETNITKYFLILHKKGNPHFNIYKTKKL